MLPLCRGMASDSVPMGQSQQQTRACVLEMKGKLDRTRSQKTAFLMAPEHSSVFISSSPVLYTSAAHYLSSLIPFFSLFLSLPFFASSQLT